MEALTRCPVQNVLDLTPPNISNTRATPRAEVGATHGKMAEVRGLIAPALFGLAPDSDTGSVWHHLPAADSKPPMVPRQARSKALEAIPGRGAALFLAPIPANKVLSALTKESRVRVFLARLRRAAPGSR